MYTDMVRLSILNSVLINGQSILTYLSIMNLNIDILFVGIFALRAEILMLKAQISSSWKPKL